MKLAASLFCVAALSLVGCAGVETTGGGQGEGIIPEKTLSLDPEEDVEEPLSPELAGMQQVPGREPAGDICEDCETVVFKGPSDTDGIDEVRLVKDGGFEVCRIYLNDNMVVIDECGAFSP